MTADVRKGQPSVQLTKEELRARVLARFYDPIFETLGEELNAIVDATWDAYDAYRKSPRHLPAGEGFADPKALLPAEWLAARAAIKRAEAQQAEPSSKSRILIVAGAARSDQTCPGEMSKTYRLATLAKTLVDAEPSFEADLLDLSVLTSEYGRVIYPCKGCVSTAMPLCHWPCSCYPNHAMGQAGDWMNELYPRWAAAHGVMIVTPVYWYQAPSTLKLMMDRLVCADGGNPDPTSTGGKDAARAKALELKGWSYPRHLAGRAFSVVVHGDAAGVETLQAALSGWLKDMHLVPATPAAELGRYLGYYEPYATSHAALDRDEGFQEETKNCARALIATVKKLRAGEGPPALSDPRPK